MSENDRDSFWDIEKLIPPKKSPSLHSFSTKEKTVEVVTEGGSEGYSSDERKLTFPNMGVTSRRPDFVYEKQGGLIKRVTVKHLPDKYDFHANFVKAALLYYDFKGTPCEFAQYYSYMPQYTQLTLPQKNYYFYWRTELRRGNYIKIDYSYFYLYIYELINLPDKMPRAEALKIMIRLWREYRAALPQIDVNMAIWVQDMCLVYDLPSPTAEIKDFVFGALGSSGFKEFYLSEAESMGEDGVTSVLAYLSDYDWRQGKFAGGDNREAYSKHLTGAMSELLRHLFYKKKIMFDEGENSVMERTAFRSALCTADVKYRLRVEYRRISEESGLRRTVTSAIKYTENKLRALMGIKSRLAVKELSEEYRAVIDGYFAELFDRVNRERMLASRPEYEKLYEAESTELSISGADEIERSSWLNTARLVVEEGEEAEEQSTPAVKAEEAPAPAGGVYGLGEDELAFLAAALDGRAEDMRLICSKLQLPEEAVMDRINEAFADGFGDVVLEVGDNGCCVIEDYREDIEECLNR